MAPSIVFAAPALVFEPYSGTVVYAEDADAQWFPASLTKLMMAYLTFQAFKTRTVTPDTKVICSGMKFTPAISSGEVDLPHSAECFRYAAIGFVS